MEEMKYQYIMYEKSEGIATVTINRPEVRNAPGMTVVRACWEDAVADCIERLEKWY